MEIKLPPRLFFVLFLSVCSNGGCCYRERCRPTTVARRREQNGPFVHYHYIQTSFHRLPSLFTELGDLKAGGRQSRPTAQTRFLFSLPPLVLRRPLFSLCFSLGLLCRPSHSSRCPTQAMGGGVMRFATRPARDWLTRSCTLMTVHPP